MKKTMTVIALVAFVSGCAQPYVRIGYRNPRGPVVAQVAAQSTQYPVAIRTNSYQPYVPQKSAEEKAKEEYFLNGILNFMGAAYAYGLKNMKDGKGSYNTSSSRYEVDLDKQFRETNCSSYIYSDNPWAQAYTNYSC